MSAVSDAPFVSRRGRAMALVMGLAAVAIFTVVAFLVPGTGNGGTWALGDRLMMTGVGLGIAALLWRYATIRAVPGERGLRVRNLMISRDIAWDDIEQVRFVDGDPWVSLELLDTEVVAVMAIQRADGASSRAEALRLVSLVEAHQGR